MPLCTISSSHTTTRATRGTGPQSPVPHLTKREVVIIKKQKETLQKMADEIEKLRTRYYDKRAKGALAFALGLLREAVLELRAEAAE